MDDLIRFRCNHCGKVNKVPGNASGRVAQCPHCKGVNRVPPKPDGMVRFPCANCQVTIKVPMNALGKKVNCPSCHHTNLVPTPETHQQKSWLITRSPEPTLEADELLNTKGEASDGAVSKVMESLFFEASGAGPMLDRPVPSKDEEKEQLEAKTDEDQTENPLEPVEELAPVGDDELDDMMTEDIMEAAIASMMGEEEDDPDKPKSVIIGNSEIPIEDIAEGESLISDEAVEFGGEDSDASWASVLEYVNRIDEPMDGADGMAPSELPNASEEDSAAERKPEVKAETQRRAVVTKQKTDDKPKAVFDAGRLFESAEMMPTEPSDEPVRPPAKAGGIGPLIGVGVAVLVIAVVIVWQSGVLSTGMKTVPVYYDVVNRQIFNSDQQKLPPFQNSKGNQAVVAVMYACGDCGEVGQRFIGYLQRCTGHARDAKVEYDQRFERGYSTEEADALRLIIRDGVEVADPNEQDWFAAQSLQGQAVRNQVMCPGTSVPADQCTPEG